MSKKLSSGSEVGGPTEPPSMTGIEVHIHTYGRQLLDGILNSSLGAINVSSQRLQVKLSA